MESRTINLLLAQNVYSMATQAALEIFEKSRAFPHGGPKSLRSQIISCSGNVCSDLSAAWQNRNTRNVFMDNLEQAASQAGNVVEFLEESIRLEFLDKDIATVLIKTYSQLIEKINDMLENIQNG